MNYEYFEGIRLGGVVGVAAGCAAALILPSLLCFLQEAWQSLGRRDQRMIALTAAVNRLSGRVRELADALGHHYCEPDEAPPIHGGPKSKGGLEH